MWSGETFEEALRCDQTERRKQGRQLRGGGINGVIRSMSSDNVLVGKVRSKPSFLPVTWGLEVGSVYPYFLEN
jgi:hypothetical protein